MASCLVVLSSKGKALISRNYRHDVPYSTETFVEKVIDEEESQVKPVFNVGGVTFAWVKHNNLYFVLMGKINCNAAMLIVYLHNLIKVLQEYTENVTEESIRDNFVVIYELLDEMMDFGYPQFTEPKVLRQYITQESHKLRILDDDDGPKDLPSAMTGAIGSCPWRPTGIKYKKNEVFLDVVDSINLLMNTAGEVIHSEIMGALKMRVKLSGMPEVKVGLNDKALFEITSRKAKGKTVELEDVRFHQCVKLNRFDADRTISFIPPDGEFDLMTYRLPAKVKPLIKIDAQVERHSGTRLEYLVKATSQFKKSSTASGVVITIPVPPDADSPVFKQSTGTVKYIPDKDCVEWTIKLFPSMKEFLCKCTFGLPSIRQHDSAIRRPISVKFEIPYFSASNVLVRYCKVEEASGYQALPWVRYITRAGNYEIRMN
eukprot:TRINITY_DN11066_c0_g1_i1.p1 TRINITY_DN11066_c0_g1~~TRINITY_DN11066_c0_g1_i1.p1  ORF type:complete len:443 (+),score=175.23 TRINITY_DN11066_c0_g1_i1:42-1331(+)